MGEIRSNLHAAITIQPPNSSIQLVYPCGECGLLHNEYGVPIIGRLFMEDNNNEDDSP